jgi:hypothetical protein
MNNSELREDSCRPYSGLVLYSAHHPRSDASLASASPKLASLVDENRESPFDGMFVGNVKIPNHSPALRSQQAY